MPGHRIVSPDRRTQREALRRRLTPRPPVPEFWQTPAPAKPSAWPEAGVMHWRLEDARLGALDMSCDTGYVVQAYDLGSPEVREVTVPNSLDDGNFDVTRYYGPRAISLDIALKPHTGVAPNSPRIMSEAKLRDRLLAYTYPGIRPRIVFSEHDDDRVKQAMIRGAEASVAVSQPAYNKLNVSWVVPRGAYWSYTERCYQFRFDATTPDSQTVTIVNEGSAPAYWRAKLRGEVTQPRFLLNGTPLLWLDYTAGPTEIVEAESFSRTVSLNGAPIGYRYVEDNSTWFQIPSGESQLTVEIDVGDLNAYPEAFWQPEPVEQTFWADNKGLPGGNPPNNPSPVGRPPWAWTTKYDPVTGRPSYLDVQFCYYDTFL
jgi:hypothetical protein